MLLALAMGAAMQIGEPMPVRTTPLGGLAACKAETLYQAAECLRSNLSVSDRTALVANQRGSSIRGQIDRLVQYEFRLYEASSGVGQWLSKRGITSPLAQAGVIIEEYLSQQRGTTLDLRAVAKATQAVPAGKPPTAEELAATPEAETPVIKISREECAAVTKLPPEELGECFKQADRIKVIRQQKASVN